MRGAPRRRTERRSDGPPDPLVMAGSWVRFPPNIFVGPRTEPRRAPKGRLSRYPFRIKNSQKVHSGPRADFSAKIRRFTENRIFDRKRVPPGAARPLAVARVRNYDRKLWQQISKFKMASHFVKTPTPDFGCPGPTKREVFTRAARLLYLEFFR